MKAVAWARTGYGAFLFVWPGVTGLVTRHRAGLAGRTVVRVLGVREVGQALVCAPRPTSDVRRLSAGVDLLHAATMLALATRSKTWRRPALASMAVAASFSVVALGSVGNSPRTTGTPLRLTTETRARQLDRLLDLRDRCARTVVHTAEARSGSQALLGGIR